MLGDWEVSETPNSFELPMKGNAAPGTGSNGLTVQSAWMGWTEATGDFLAKSFGASWRSEFRFSAELSFMSGLSQLAFTLSRFARNNVLFTPLSLTHRAAAAGGPSPHGATCALNHAPATKQVNPWRWEGRMGSAKRFLAMKGGRSSNSSP